MTAPADDRPKVLDRRDWELSNRLSRPARDPRLNRGLRGLLLRRLDPHLKAVWRVGLRSDRCSIYCEHCHAWYQLTEGEQPDIWTCRGCGRRFQIEVIVYSEVGS